MNGRISAVNSQLSGLSAMRRRAGRPDIDFPPEKLAEYKQAGSLREIVKVGARGLDEDEAVRLAAASSAKLLELAGYRPYELDAGDCTFIQKSMSRVLPAMAPANRALGIHTLSGTAARLAAQGQVGSALRLCPPRFYPHFLGRLALRVTVSPSVRYQMRRLVGRPAMVK